MKQIEGRWGRRSAYNVVLIAVVFPNLRPLFDPAHCVGMVPDTAKATQSQVHSLAHLSMIVLSDELSD